MPALNKPTTATKNSTIELILTQLLSDPGDILLVEQADRLSRLKAADWERLKAELAARKVRVVALDLPTSWMPATKHPDEFTSRMFGAVNGMMLDMLAAVARKDYDDRRRWQTQGIEKAKAEGGYNGRPEDIERNATIATNTRAPSSRKPRDAAAPLLPRSPSGSLKRRRRKRVRSK